MVNRKAVKKTKPVQDKVNEADRFAGCSGESNPQNGITVAIPNTIREKMSAINTLADAVCHLAKAVSSVNCPVLISGCHVHNNGNYGVKVGFDTDPETRLANQISEYIRDGGRLK